MVKVIGKMKTGKKPKEATYGVRRKSRTNSLNCATLREYGISSFKDCSRTCEILNDSSENTERLKNKNFSGKSHFYFPTLIK